MVAIVVILAAVVSIVVLGLGEGVDDTAPAVGDTTSEFEPELDAMTQENQIVRITHIAGESVEMEETEIIFRASGPGNELPATGRLVDLPAEIITGGNIDSSNVEGDDIISRSGPRQVITEEDTNVWGAGETIIFRIATTEADFRDNPNGPEADKLEVIIVHTESNTIISEHTFTP